MSNADVSTITYKNATFLGLLEEFEPEFPLADGGVFYRLCVEIYDDPNDDPENWINEEPVPVEHYYNVIRCLTACDCTGWLRNGATFGIAACLLFEQMRQAIIDDALKAAEESAAEEAAEADSHCSLSPAILKLVSRASRGEARRGKRPD